MEIQLLTSTVAAAAEQLGYDMLLGDITQVLATHPNLTALCLEPPSLRSKSGHRRGTKTYRIECALVDSAPLIEAVVADPTHQQDDMAQLQALYDNALVLVEAIDQLAAVCEVKCNSSIPTKGKQLPAGVMALRISLDVKLKYSK